MQVLAFADISVVQAERGDTAGALATVARVPIVGERATALADVALVRLRHGDDVAARQLLAQARTMALTEADTPIRNGALVALMNAFIAAGDRPAAHGVTITLPDVVRRFATLDLAMATAAAGEMEAAKTLHGDVERKGYAAIVLGAGGKLDAAWRSAATVADLWDQVETLRSLGVLFVRAGDRARADAGDRAEAFTILNGIPPSDARDKLLALRTIAMRETAGGAAATAHAWATALPDGLERAHALLGVAEGLLGDDRAPRNSRRYDHRTHFGPVLRSRGCTYS